MDPKRRARQNVVIDDLFISNGYGEDAIAASIAAHLVEKRRVAAFPLVGNGVGYRRFGITVIGAHPPLPGGGVSFAKDFRGGLIGLTCKQWKALKNLRSEVERVVAVGDIYPAIMAHFAARKPFVFVGTAKSVDVQAYNVFEQRLLRKASAVYVRDLQTSQALQLRGVNAQFVGNPMMDEVALSKMDIPPTEGITVALIPGSRLDAPQNFLMQAEAVNALQRRLGGPIRGLVSIPPTLPVQEFVARLESFDGILGKHPGEGLLGEFNQEEVSFWFVSGCLGDVFRASRLVFGQAGTANEQACGLGKPVVAFDVSRNGKLSWYRWRQKKLLGEALSVVPPHAERLAERAYQILTDPVLYAHMAHVGQKRLGPPGGSRQIALSLV